MGTGGFEQTTLSIIGLAGTFIASVATGAWWFRGIKADLEKQIGERVDAALGATGEAITGIRTKVGLLELEIERTFVRRSDFQNALDALNRSIGDLRTEMKNEREDVKTELRRLNDLLMQLIQGKPPSSR